MESIDSEERDKRQKFVDELNKNYPDFEFEVEHESPAVMLHGLITLKKYNGEDKTVIIPNGVEIINRWAFLHNEHIETVVIPTSILYIGFRAFRACKNLKNINILPYDNYICIDPHAFEDSNNLIDKNKILEIARDPKNSMVDLPYHFNKRQNDAREQAQNKQQEQKYNDTKKQIAKIIERTILGAMDCEFNEEKLAEIVNSTANEIMEATDCVPAHLKK